MKIGKKRQEELKAAGVDISDEAAVKHYFQLKKEKESVEHQLKLYDAQHRDAYISKFFKLATPERLTELLTHGLEGIEADECMVMFNEHSRDIILYLSRYEVLSQLLRKLGHEHLSQQVMDIYYSRFNP